MFQSKSILVVLFLAISQLVAAGTLHANRRAVSEKALVHRTNAARMAAGLGPLAPSQLQRRTGKPHTPTQPNNPKPSQGKPDCDDKQSVPIKCKRKGTNQVIGYISKDYSKKGKKGFGLCNNKNDALNLDFENSVTPFNFKISKGGDLPYLGFCGNNIKSGSTDSAVLTNTRRTNQGNAPSNVGNGFPGWSANSESQIWYYSRSNKAVSPKWVNQGGISVDSKICYEPTEDLFHLVTDINAFKRKYPSAYEVDLEIDD